MVLTDHQLIELVRLCPRNGIVVIPTNDPADPHGTQDELGPRPVAAIPWTEDGNSDEEPRTVQPDGQVEQAQQTA